MKEAQIFKLPQSLKDLKNRDWISVHKTEINSRLQPASSLHLVCTWYSVRFSILKFHCKFNVSTYIANGCRAYASIYLSDVPPLLLTLKCKWKAQNCAQPKDSTRFWLNNTYMARNRGMLQMYWQFCSMGKSILIILARNNNAFQLQISLTESRCNNCQSTINIYGT